MPENEVSRAELYMIVTRLCPPYIKVKLDNWQEGDSWESWDAHLTIRDLEIALLNVGFSSGGKGPFVAQGEQRYPLIRNFLESAITEATCKDAIPFHHHIQQVAQEVVSNLLKVRNRLGFELAEAWGLSEETSSSTTIEELDRLVGPHETPTDDQLAKSILDVCSALPDIDWDEENLSDALYLEIHHIHDFVARQKKVQTVD